MHSPTQVPALSQVPIEQGVPAALLVKGEQAVVGAHVLVPVWHSVAVGHVTLCRESVTHLSAHDEARCMRGRL